MFWIKYQLLLNTLHSLTSFMSVWLKIRVIWEGKPSIEEMSPWVSTAPGSALLGAIENRLSKQEEQANKKGSDMVFALGPASKFVSWMPALTFLEDTLASDRYKRK